MKALDETDFAIVGLGLMGGSLALALRAGGACRRILGITRDPATRGRATAEGVVDEASADLALAAQADVIVLATPVRTIIRQLGQLGAIAREGAIILDMGSTKQEIVQAMEVLPPGVQPIGAHPMCGKETFGYGAADANLYRNAPFVLTPLARTLPDTVQFARRLAESVGARPLLLDAVRHDRIVAAISHLPYVLAATLMATAEQAARSDDLVFALAAGGMRDTSRLAASDVGMMMDILMTNRANVSALARAYAGRLTEIADWVEQGNETALHECLEAAAVQRRGLHV